MRLLYDSYSTLKTFISHSIGLCVAVFCMLLMAQAVQAQTCSITVKPTVSGCYSISGVSKATVSVEVGWTNAPANDYIVVTAGTQSRTITPGQITVVYPQVPGNPNVTSTTTIVSPQVVAFEIDANGSTGNALVAAFKNTASCNATSAYNAPASCAITACGGTNLRGIAFKDFNDNGKREAGESVGVAGISVKAVASDGTVYTTTTDGYGYYALPVPADKYPVRVEFSQVPTIFKLGLNGSDARTSVQFVKAPSCNINLGILNPIDYCSNTNLQVFVPCYTNGDPLAGGNAGTSDALVSFPYGLSSSTNDQEKKIALASEIGTTWGLAYNKYTKRLFQSAVIKRHAGLGPLGLGGIYATNYSNPASPTTVSFLNVVSDLGINVGTIPSNSGRGLPADKTQPSRDAAAFSLIGKAGIGDLEISEDGNMLWFINLNDKKLYSVDITQYNQDGTTKPTAANVKSYSISATCTGGEFRPWALKIYNGKVYVGAVCDAQTSGSKSNLRAFVYELDGTSFTQVFDFPLTYPKAYPALTNIDFKGWYPWTDDFNVLTGPGNGYLLYPSPIFTDIEFDVDGSMVLAFGDRTGFQGGNANYRPDGTSTTLYTVDAVGGDILRAFYANGTFVLENNAKAGPAVGYGANNSQGPGFGEFYNDNWIQEEGKTFQHAEMVVGGLALKPGSGEVVVTTIDPVDKIPYSGGVRYMNNSTGLVTGAYIVYISNPAVPGTFSKAVGLGDAELSCGLLDIMEIGNRVWLDDNKNGVQDPLEKGLAGVNVSLYKAGVLVASTTTNTDGDYYFNNSPVSSTVAGTVSTTALQENTAYQLVFGSGGQFANNILTENGGKFMLTTANSTSATGNDMNDSDAQVATVSGITAPVISLTTGDVGEANHTFDVGFYCILTTVASVSVTPATCPASGTIANSNGGVQLTGIVNADKVFLVAAGSPLPSYTATGSQPVSASAASFTGLSNPTSTSGTSYSVVLYSGPCCYTVVPALLPQTTCLPCTITTSAVSPICDPATNQYTLNGTISLTGTAGGIATITDGAVSTTVNVPASATSVAYSLTGLTSDAASHIVTASLPGCGTATAVYSAPASCTVCSLSITTSSLPAGQVGTAYSQTLTISGATAPATFSVSVGSLPAGLSLNASTGVITGTPTSATTGSFTVVVTDAKGCFDPQPLTITTSAAPVCSLKATATSGPCVPATNSYVVTGTVSATNTTGNQSLTISAGGQTTTATLTGNGPVSYTLTGLTSDGLVKTVTVMSSASVCGMASMTYTAPPSCTVAPPVTAGLGDFVFEDTDKNGQQDTGEPGISNVTVTLLSGSSVVSTTTTNGSGFYSFTGLTPGTPYSVSFTAPAGYTATLSNVGNDATDSDGGANGLTGVYSLTAGEFNPTIDMGYFTAPASTSMTITKLVSNTKATLGAVLTYTVVLTNTGSVSATNVTVRDESTTGLTYVPNSASAPAGTVFTAGTPISTWQVASLGVGQSLTLTFQAKADSSGVLYNTATIPGDTAKVCTTIPVKVCAGDTYLFRLTAAPGRSSYKWFKDNVEIAGQTTNVLEVTAPGTYSLAVDNVTGKCPDFSCCPFIIEEDTLPTFQAMATPVTCVGSTPQSNGKITLSQFTAGNTYQYSLGTTFNEAASLSGAARVIPAGGVIVNNLASPATAQAYTVRVYNASGCYTDVTVILTPTVCSCPTDVCVPLVIKQTKGPRR